MLEVTFFKGDECELDRTGFNDKKEEHEKDDENDLTDKVLEEVEALAKV